MSEQALSLIITAAIIALMFAWAPFLNFVCPPCGRALEHLRLRKEARQETYPTSLPWTSPTQREVAASSFEFEIVKSTPSIYPDRDAPAQGKERNDAITQRSEILIKLPNQIPKAPGDGTA